MAFLLKNRPACMYYYSCVLCLVVVNSLTSVAIVASGCIC